MRGIYLGGAIVALLLTTAGCQKNTKADDIATMEARLARLSEALANPDTADAGKPVARWNLPIELAEVSGLALTPDGRLFGHNDELARVTEIDYRRGTIVKHFFVGEANLTDDFEAIAVAGDRFFMLTSKGLLYEFPEGADGERVPFTLHDTKLGKDCEFESVAYDSTTNALVLACKNVKLKRLHGMVVLYRYPLGTSGEITDLVIPYADAIGKNDWKQVRPTDITVDPSNGNYVLVAAQEKALLSITRTGEVAISRPIGSKHPQSEGIAITRDHILIIGDEATNGPGTITLYRWP